MTYEVFDIAYEWNKATDYIEWYGDIAGKLGYSNDRLSIVHRWRELIHPEDRKNLEYLPPVANNGETKVFYNIYRIRHKNGRYIEVHDYGTVIQDWDGMVLKCVGLIGV